MRGFPIPRSGAAALVALMVFSYAEPGHACSVCINPGSPNTDAFTWSTIFLSLMPFVAVGGTIFWIRQALRRQADRPEDRFAHSPVAAGPSRSAT